MLNSKLKKVESKKIISYLPERTYLDKTMTVNQTINYFKDFYDDFDIDKARKLLQELNLDTNQKLSKMSKGMQEKVYGKGMGKPHSKAVQKVRGYLYCKAEVYP